MFWGLQLEANLRYSQQVPEGFRITKATLSTEAPAAVLRSHDLASKLVQVFVEQDGSDYAIATLKHGEIYDCSMDLRFAEGEDICFYLKGDGIVFLTGHNTATDENDISFMPQALMGGSDSESADGSSGGDDSSDIGVQIEEIPDRAKPKAILPKQSKPGFEVQGADEEEDDDDADEDGSDESESSSDEDEDESEEEDSESDEDEDEEQEQQRHSKPKVTPGAKRTEISAQLKANTPDPKKVKLQNGSQSASRMNGDAKRTSEVLTPSQSAKKAAAHPANESVQELIIEDIKKGTGPPAKKGKILHVYYSGYLMSGKKFDAQSDGKPFQFKLGTGSVIKGWDRGLEGMKVGGVRRIVVPPGLAYGKRRMGPIPADSALRFEVELKAMS